MHQMQNGLMSDEYTQSVCCYRVSGHDQANRVKQSGFEEAREEVTIPSGGFTLEAQ